MAIVKARKASPHKEGLEMTIPREVRLQKGIQDGDELQVTATRRGFKVAKWDPQNFEEDEERE